ncbi:DUF2218 domain-containing protein [Roseibium aestuarii]|uniref:DUF2218 domain-containing protein n=1 Tax=Roseibium aestuarii TaxID=2600299 RepID=A0ABW4K0Q7_9HYPH|nr:DUF2218 domain-containing protein [Roseibium aestuarii]
MSLTETPPLLARTTIETAHASKYLQQLCKHFAHKRPVTSTPEEGSITFGVGTCRLTAAGSALRIDLESTSETDLEQLKDVVIRHLVRFAFREELLPVWS